MQALRAIMLPAQAAPGFISCRLLVDTEDSQALSYVEEWRTTEDLDRHICSTEFTRLLALMEEAAKPPDLRLSWVTEVRGLEYLESVRLGDSFARHH